MAFDKPHDKPLDKTLDKPIAPAVKAKGDTLSARDVDPDAPPPPVIRGLAPASAAVGDPSFGLHVLGSGFNEGSVLVFAGQDEPTTLQSSEELTTGMNMPLWLGADQLSVQVRNADGQLSNIVMFDLQPPRVVPLDPAEPSKPTPAVDQI